jgi:hypothetical protein
MTLGVTVHKEYFVAKWPNLELKLFVKLFVLSLVDAAVFCSLVYS